MTKQELKNKIGEQIGRNMYYMTAVSTNASVTRELGNNIKLLQGINIQMSESDETEYNRGLNDAWELAQRIACQWSIGYSIEELDEIFGNERIGTASTMRNYTYQEALAKVEAYEKKKAEEEAKLEPGDVVAVDSRKCVGYKGIIEKVDDKNITMLTRYGRINFKSSQTQQFNIRKTGERLDNYLELFEIFNGKMERINND